MEDVAACDAQTITHHRGGGDGPTTAARTLVGNGGDAPGPLGVTVECGGKFCMVWGGGKSMGVRGKNGVALGFGEWGCAVVVLARVDGGEEAGREGEKEEGEELLHAQDN